MPHLQISISRLERHFVGMTPVSCIASMLTSWFGRQLSQDSISGRAGIVADGLLRTRWKERSTRCAPLHLSNTLSFLRTLSRATHPTPHTATLLAPRPYAKQGLSQVSHVQDGAEDGVTAGIRAHLPAHTTRAAFLRGRITISYHHLPRYPHSVRTAQRRHKRRANEQARTRHCYADDARTGRRACQDMPLYAVWELA